MNVKYLLSGSLLLGLLSCRPVSESEKEMKQFLGWPEVFNRIRRPVRHCEQNYPHDSL
jgi:hypothetical protein